MADSLLNNSTAESSAGSPSERLGWMFLSMAVLTFFLMALGSTTRVMNAGLSCPDWPLCYGELVPAQQMNLQVFLEWFHRLVASSIGFLMIALTGMTLFWRKQIPRWVPVAAGLCLLLVIAQGILGGLTVTQLLRFDIVTAHLATGLMFFSCLLGIGAALVTYQGTGVVGRLSWLGMAAVGCVYGQSILGGVVASRWAAHQCLGGSRLCSVMYSHFAGVVPAVFSVVVLVVLAMRTAALHPRLRMLTQIMTLLLGLQVVLGVSTLRLHLQVVALTVAHQAIGAALLGSLVLFTVWAWRDGREPGGDHRSQDLNIGTNL
ncbi:Heme A synthase [Acaryochloris thomasi RCC1774]|uniref:Heme A synthase n=1 Tax=Acaryochloris thomasi RCC1774 TaxID=1764569 RepID=A0A2W1JSV1_9CYAN|nr:COX15/CtaA family protein [Acaryochloris thomasi]PZD74225.1 Heme A synthase [Acaryochloris thomasi RCC1774]